MVVHENKTKKYKKQCLIILIKVYNYRAFCKQN